MSWSSYVGQKRKNESGPVALINLGKKIDVKFGYRQYIKRFRALCGCTDTHTRATSISKFDFALMKIFGWVGPIVRVQGPTSQELEDIIANYNGVALHFNAGPYAEQYVLVTHTNWAGFTVVNLSKGSPTMTDLARPFVDDLLKTGDVTLWAVKSLL